MPTPRADDADRNDDPTPLDGDDFLAVNRANRERIRADEAKRAEGDASTESDATEQDAPEAEATDTGDSGAAAATGAGRAARRRPGATTALGALVVVLAVAVAVLGVLLARSSDSGDGSTADEALLKDAKSHAALILTYQFGKCDDLDRRIRGISTPQFADRYVTSSQEARKANDQVQASSTATADIAGVVSRNGDEAVVLVALDQKVTSPQAQESGGIDYQSRVRLTLVRDGDRWIVSDLETV